MYVYLLEWYIDSMRWGRNFSFKRNLYLYIYLFFYYNFWFLMQVYIKLINNIEKYIYNLVPVNRIK